ncbi:MAG: CBS domain-containing protein [Alphaproteobacteria bacterium]|nr:CBS domain-containing protein [Alphaproteobacteria bacterium]
MQHKIVPDVVHGQELSFVSAECSVRDAVKAMARRRISAVMVMDEERLIGIFTERDLALKVVARDLNPSTTEVGAVMTRDPDTLAPDDTAHRALTLMRERGYRHLPVVDGERVVGMVSVRDLYDTVLSELEDDIRERDAYIHGVGYGLGN